MALLITSSEDVLPFLSPLNEKRLNFAAWVHAAWCHRRLAHVPDHRVDVCEFEAAQLAKAAAGGGGCAGCPCRLAGSRAPRISF